MPRQRKSSSSSRKKKARKKEPEKLAELKPKGAEFLLTEKQAQAFKALTNDQDADVLFGGGKGGGKSFFLCLWIAYWATYIAKLLQVEPSRTPLPVGWFGRKRAVDFGDTTMETFKRVVPASEYRINDQAKEIIFRDRVKVLFGGLDDEANVNKFNSSEFAFFAIDQAEETSKTDVAVLEGSLRLTHNGLKPPYKKLFTANPADCWLKDHFIINGRGVFIPALYRDNPHLPAGYEKTLENAFGYDQALLAAYRDGDWDAVRSEYVLIPSSSIQALKGRQVIEPQITRLWAVDPSMGGDECIVHLMENSKILKTKSIHEKDTMKITGEIDFGCRYEKVYDVAIDKIGIGEGIASRLRELGNRVYPINSALRQNPKFNSLRAEMWFHAAELIKQKKCEYPEDEELRRQLSAVRFKIVNSNGEMALEPKELTKKRLGRSPDRADAFIYGLWAKDHGYFEGRPQGAFNHQNMQDLPRTADFGS